MNLQLSKLRRLRFVKRWPITPNIKEQSVADHTFHVLWIFMVLAESLHFPIEIRDVWLVLGHDVEEAVTGDIPAVTKKSKVYDAPEWTELSLLIKVADLVEALLFVAEEKAIGSLVWAGIEAERDAELAKVILALEKLNSLKYPYSRMMGIINEIEASCHATRHPALVGTPYE